MADPLFPALETPLWDSIKVFAAEFDRRNREITRLRHVLSNACLTIEALGRSDSAEMLRGHIYPKPDDDSYIEPEWGPDSYGYDEMGQ